MNLPPSPEYSPCKDPYNDCSNPDEDPYNDCSNSDEDPYNDCSNSDEEHSGTSSLPTSPRSPRSPHDSWPLSSPKSPTPSEYQPNSSVQCIEVEVSNLPPSVPLRKLSKIFSATGPFERISKPKPGKARIIYSNEEDAVTAVNYWHNQERYGKILTCDYIHVPESEGPILSRKRPSSSPQHFIASKNSKKYSHQNEILLRREDAIARKFEYDNQVIISERLQTELEDKIERLENENQVIADENERLQTEMEDKIKRLENENQVFLDKNERLQTYRKVLADKNEKLGEEAQILTDKNERLQKARQVLADKIEKLENERQVLTEQNEKLENERQVFADKNERLENDKIALEDNIKRLITDKEVIEDQNISHGMERQILEDKNQKLERKLQLLKNCIQTDPFFNDKDQPPKESFVVDNFKGFSNPIDLYLRQSYY